MLGNLLIFLISATGQAISWTLSFIPYIMQGRTGLRAVSFPPSGADVGDRAHSLWNADSGWLILGIGVLAVLVAIAWYVIAKIRPNPAQKEPLASQWLTKYGELHSKGVLSDEEFRTIKTKLAEQLQDELNDNGDDG